MPTISKSVLAPYSAAQMFAVVDDVESYPLFLPWCKSAKVLSRSGDEVRARIEMARGSIHKSFSTCNRRQQDKMIEIRLLEGPFRHLEGFWRFDALGESACKVSLDMDFEFSNRVVGVALGPVFSQIANTLVDAFHKRATAIYA